MNTYLQGFEIHSGSALRSAGRGLTMRLFVSTLLLAGLVGCKGGGGEEPTCPEGSQNCPCKTDGTCDTGLSCQDDFCVPSAVCPEGSSGCACYANGTCDGDLTCSDNVCTQGRVTPGGLNDPCDAARPCGTHEGTQLECKDGTCQLPASCTAGTLNCPCGTGNTCGLHEGTQLECKDGTCQLPATCTAGTLDCPCGTGNTCGLHEGTQLECRAGTCQLPTVCPAGSIGCPCNTGDTCGLHEGTQLQCVTGLCQVPGCPAGTSGCPCTATGGCDTGLDCQDGTCRPAVLQHGLTIGNAAVRACGMVFSQEALSVTFADTVIGVSKRDGVRLAISFTSKGDAALAAPVAAFGDAGGSRPDPGTLQPTQVECFDRLGAPIAAPDLRFQ